MEMAIAATRRGIASGQMPYGAAIVRRGKLLGCAHNVVMRTGDPTMHAEVQAIRALCQKLRTADLSGCEIYCTCEPCFMCMGACCFAKISAIYFGAAIEDKSACDLPDPGVGAAAICRLIRNPPKIVTGFMRDSCLELFGAYSQRRR